MQLLAKSQFFSFTSQEFSGVSEMSNIFSWNHNIHTEEGIYLT